MIFCGRGIKEWESMPRPYFVAVASGASLVVMGVLVVNFEPAEIGFQ